LGGPGEEFIGGCGWSVHACKKADAVHRPVAEMLAQPCSLAVDCSVAQTIRPKKSSVRRIVRVPNLRSTTPLLQVTGLLHLRVRPVTEPKHQPAPTCVAPTLTSLRVKAWLPSHSVSTPRRIAATGPLARHNAFT
jgi:hypothetical protein